MDLDRPWLRHYGAIAHNLDYPKATLHGALAEVAARRPDSIALEFFGWECSYR